MERRIEPISNVYAGGSKRMICLTLHGRGVSIAAVPVDRSNACK
jgi:hypothetical protein